MSETFACDICVIGAGSGGLSVAAGAAQLGARTVLIEGGRMGGDCLNVGCVPSKSLIAAAEAASIGRRSHAFGVEFAAPAIDWTRVHAHIDGVIAAIAPHDSVERFESLGVRVIRAWAKFVGPQTVEAGGRRITAKRFVLAVGSSPAVPNTPGLSGVSYLTNETIFALNEPMRHLLIIGGGPIGAELAQAYARLGTAVTVIEQDHLLARADPALVAVVREALLKDGVALREGRPVARVERRGGEIAVHVAGAAILGSHLLVATGRRPNLDQLDLAAAGITHSPRGIAVDRRLRTSNKRIFAIGDCADLPGTGPLAFTHVAGHHAGIVIRNALFRLPAKINPDLVPRVTFTDPELASVGLSMAEAEARFPGFKVVESPFRDNDRARTARATEGLIRIAAARNGRILGVAIVGRGAGELLAPWCLAMTRGLKLSAMADLLLPYPTLGEVSKRAAGQYYAPRLFGAGTRRLVGALLRLP
jgi:pyruvate/2-oxoglutarate dehydrogenase complex dihydrolipoamide dehydrogenase (E3) component